MPSPILARADALMQRHSPGQSASHEVVEDFPLLTDAFDEEDNIPILLQVDTPPPSLLSPPQTQSAHDPTKFAADLAQALEKQLHAALPALIERAVAEVMAQQVTVLPSAAITE
ncbi:hypothetical protein [Azonexus sp.]|uniref:hypothetical protein n=1 Tax=Azonexus sp. TaxID=1872668 RepID=UPI0039E2917D